MGATIQYINDQGATIAEEQCSVLEGYSKITYINDRLKKKEEFFNMRRYGDGRFLEYFLDPSEDRADVLQSYADGKTSCSLRFNEKRQNGFTQWDNEEYSKSGVLKWAGKVVYDNFNRLLMYCYFDLNTGILLNGAKTLYNNRFPIEPNDDVLARFEYDQSGNLKSIADPEIRLGDGDLLSLDDFLEFAPDFLWEDHPYFHSMTPYLPDSSEI